VQRTVGWTLCGAGTVAVALGGMLAVVAKGKYDEAASESGTARDATSRDAREFVNSAAFLLVAGGATVVSGVVVLLTAPSAPSAPLSEVSIATNGREILLSGTF
jgi:hypothetical protein